jgi:hypothetical protein
VGGWVADRPESAIRPLAEEEAGGKSAIELAAKLGQRDVLQVGCDRNHRHHHHHHHHPPWQIGDRARRQLQVGYEGRGGITHLIPGHEAPNGDTVRLH